MYSFMLLHVNTLGNHGQALAFPHPAHLLWSIVSKGRDARYLFVAHVVLQLEHSLKHRVRDSVRVPGQSQLHSKDAKCHSQCVNLNLRKTRNGDQAPRSKVLQSIHHEERIERSAITRIRIHTQKNTITDIRRQQRAETRPSVRKDMQYRTTPSRLDLEA